MSRQTPISSLGPFCARPMRVSLQQFPAKTYRAAMSLVEAAFHIYVMLWHDMAALYEVLKCTYGDGIQTALNTFRFVKIKLTLIDVIRTPVECRRRSSDTELTEEDHVRL